MAELLQLHQPSPTQTTLWDATRAFLASVDLAASTLEVYEATFEHLIDGVELAGDTDITKISRAALKRHLDERYGSAAPATYNRNLATISSLFSWCEENDLIVRSPTRGLRRRKQRVTVESERQSRPVPYDDLAKIWSDKAHGFRDRVFWAMAYDTAARADELLGVNIENLDAANREAVIIGKGGSAERIYWSSTTARLLPRLLTYKALPRTGGPLFVGDRKPRSHLAPAAADIDPVSGRARLSYRRAEEIWKAASGGHTLHQLRHSRLTHLAEAGEDVTMIKAKSRHRSLRSLERYVNPSPTAIKELTNKHDPNKR